MRCAPFPLSTQTLSTLNLLYSNFSAKRRMRPVRPNCFWAARRISSIPRLRSLEVFYFRISRWSLNQNCSVNHVHGIRMKDQLKMKIRSLAFASLFVLSAGTSLTVHAGPYSSAQGNTTVEAIDPGIGGFVTSGGVETGTASGNSVNPRFVG